MNRLILISLTGLLSACTSSIINSVISNRVDLSKNAEAYLNTGAAASIDQTEIIAYTTDLKRLKQQFGGLIIETDALNSTALFRAQGAWTSRLIMQQLQADPGIEYAEPNITADLPQSQTQSFQTKLQPNEPLLKQASIKYPLDLLNAYQSWDYSQGKESVTVAVIDTGVDYQHPDLQGRITEGYDFVNEKPLAQDDHGHGTHIAGIIAANINNGLGIAGLAPGVKIMPLKVLDQRKGGKFRNAARAIRWAIDKKADVINLSLSGNTDNNDLRAAIQQALDQDIVIVAAMGNDQGNAPKYPALYSDMGIISVGAVNAERKRASFSNFGKWISVVAPGERIISTTFKGNNEGPCINGSGNSCYTSIDGTSQAAPYVAALAALLRSVKPDLKGSQIKALIEENSQDLGASGFDEEYGNGLIQPLASLQQSGANPPIGVEQPFRINRVIASPFFIKAGDTVSLSMQTNTQAQTYGWAVADGEIEGQGQVVKWTPRTAGNYQIVAGAQANGQAIFAASSVIVFE